MMRLQHQPQVARVPDRIIIPTGPIYRAPPNMISRIQEAVTAHYDLPDNAMVSDRRNRRETYPRQVAMYLSRGLTTLSLPAIGRRFGDRDHSTVIHAIKRVEQRLAAEEDGLAAAIALIKGKLV